MYLNMRRSWISLPKKKGAENCMRNSYNYYNSTRTPKLVVRNERDVMLKPAVTSITSVVFGCLSFPTPSTFFLSFSPELLKVRDSIVSERFYDGLSSRTVKKHVYKKRTWETHENGLCVQHERDVPLLVETHTQKRRLLYGYDKVQKLFQNFFRVISKEKLLQF